MNLGWRAYVTGFGMTMGLIALGALLEPHVGVAAVGPTDSALHRPFAHSEAIAEDARPSGLRTASAFVLPAPPLESSLGPGNTALTAATDPLDAGALELFLHLSAGGNDPGLALVDWEAIAPEPEAPAVRPVPADDALATLPRPYTMNQWRSAMGRIELTESQRAEAVAIMEEFDLRWSEFSERELGELRALRAHVDLARIQSIEPAPRTWLRLRELWERQPKVQEYQLAIWRGLTAEQRSALEAELVRMDEYRRQSRGGGAAEGGNARPVEARVGLRQGHAVDFGGGR